MRVLLWLLGLVMGFGLGFAAAAWALYEPIPIGPAKYALMRSAGPVPAYALDGSKKLFRIECISESEKDCLPLTATPIPEPGVLSLMGMGFSLIFLRKPS